MIRTTRKRNQIGHVKTERKKAALIVGVRLILVKIAEIKERDQGVLIAMNLDMCLRTVPKIRKVLELRRGKKKKLDVLH